MEWRNAFVGVFVLAVIFGFVLAFNGQSVVAGQGQPGDDCSEDSDCAYESCGCTMGCPSNGQKSCCSDPDYPPDDGHCDTDQDCKGDVCGGGGARCPGGGGSHICECQDDSEDYCNDVGCTDLNSDDDHCGSCSNECDEGKECKNGECKNPACLDDGSLDITDGNRFTLAREYRCDILVNDQ
jgi:hypothetical protein